MAFFDWEEGYSVKIPSIDDQHKKLISFINDAHEALTSGKSPADIVPMIESLLEYTKYHFAHEESLFKKYSYPNLEQHATQHTALTGKVVDYFAALKEGRDVDLLEVFAFLVDWLQEHIMKTDMQYSDYLLGYGVR